MLELYTLFLSFFSLSFHHYHNHLFHTYKRTFIVITNFFMTLSLGQQTKKQKKRKNRGIGFSYHSQSKTMITKVKKIDFPHTKHLVLFFAPLSDSVFSTTTTTTTKISPSCVFLFLFFFFRKIVVQFANFPSPPFTKCGLFPSISLPSFVMSHNQPRLLSILKKKRKRSIFLLGLLHQIHNRG
eukprot:UN01544